MIVYWLSRSKYAGDLSGKGAEQHGGRWNSKGTPLLYTSQSRALCVLEIAVHTALGILPEDLELTEIELPSIMVAKLHGTQLPENWNRNPSLPATQKMGDNFVRKGMQLALQVPSAIVQGDFNYLINPAHPDATAVKIISRTPFHFDHRLGRFA